MLTLPPTVQADGIQARSAEIEVNEEGWWLNADFEVELSPALTDAVQRGVALYFVADVELRRSRWYWLDERVIDMEIPIRLTYNALTRQYRVLVASGPLAQRYDDIAEAARAIGRLQHVRIGEHGNLVNGQTYRAAVRMRLDSKQLPRPFQLSAFTNKEWVLQSGWLRWQFKSPSPRDGN